jgi:hypothetical protein
VALFAEEKRAPIDDEQVIQVRLKDLEVRNARQWGGCWLVCALYEQLKLERFWAERLPPGRKAPDGICFYKRYVYIVLFILSRYTQPEADLQLLLKHLKLESPEQPPPKITASGRLAK